MGKDRSFEKKRKRAQTPIKILSVGNHFTWSTSHKALAFSFRQVVVRHQLKMEGNPPRERFYSGDQPSKNFQGLPR
jgi:hypothetical protein